MNQKDCTHTIMMRSPILAIVRCWVCNLVLTDEMALALHSIEIRTNCGGYIP